MFAGQLLLRPRTLLTPRRKRNRRATLCLRGSFCRPATFSYPERIARSTIGPLFFSGYLMLPLNFFLTPRRARKRRLALFLLGYLASVTPQIFLKPRTEPMRRSTRFFRGIFCYPSNLSDAGNESQAKIDPLIARYLLFPLKSSRRRERRAIEDWPYSCGVSSVTLESS